MKKKESKKKDSIDKESKRTRKRNCESENKICEDVKKRKKKHNKDINMPVSEENEQCSEHDIEIDGKEVEIQKSKKKRKHKKKKHKTKK